jgi:nicotinate-nucleotide pyrophosphorylase (carboxylating)
LETRWFIKDGDSVQKGTVFGEVRGCARSIVTAERLALNLMQRMSGVATFTRKMVDAIQDPDPKILERRGIPADQAKRTRILDTRKTAPGLRIFDKYAVKLGGASNHRIGLYDMVMIKDNHVTAAGGVKQAVSLVKQSLQKKDKFKKMKVILETRTFDEVKEALEVVEDIDQIMLDNMVKFKDGEAKDADSVDTSMLEEALVLIGTKPVDTEMSGNVTLQSIPAISRTGVTFISSGALTHSVMAFDISLKIKLAEK